jgi:hypothetical protein
LSDASIKTGIDEKSTILFFEKVCKGYITPNLFFDLLKISIEVLPEQ